MFVCCGVFFFFKGYGDHRNLPVLTHSFPTRRSSDRADQGALPQPGMVGWQLLFALAGRGDEAPGFPPWLGRGWRRIGRRGACSATRRSRGGICRSEEHTSELQSLMRISYAVFCLNKKKHTEITNKRRKNKRQH